MRRFYPPLILPWDLFEKWLCVALRSPPPPGSAFWFQSEGGRVKANGSNRENLLCRCHGPSGGALLHFSWANCSISRSVYPGERREQNYSWGLCSQPSLTRTIRRRTKRTCCSAHSHLAGREDRPACESCRAAFRD